MSEKESDAEKQVLNAIREAWGRNPSMRLTQLLINVIPRTELCSDVYYCSGQVKLDSKI